MSHKMKQALAVVQKSSRQIAGVVAGTLATGLAHAAITYPVAADLMADAQEQSENYFNAAIAVSGVFVIGFAAWRYMKKAGAKL